MDKLRIKMQKGSVMVLFAVLLPIFVFFVSVVVDFARAHAHKAYLQNVADAAALAGVKTVVPTETARLVPDYPGDENDANLADASTNAKADSAADKSVESNGDSANPFTSVDKKLKKNGESYYYKVKIIEHVPLLVARAFLPNSVMPDGFPVEVVAWASIDSPSVEGENDLYTKLYRIGQEQIVKDNVTLKNAGYVDRAERVHQDNFNGIYFSESDGKVSRTETIVPKEVGTISTGREGTWKYLFIDFEPEIKIQKKYGTLIDEKYIFPFDSWDLGMELTDEQWGWVQYTSIYGLTGRTYSRKGVIDALMSQFNLEDRDKALEVLSSPITNIVSFSALNHVRGGIAYVEDLEKRRQMLETWEIKKKKESFAQKESLIANYTNNAYLEDLVVRSRKIKRILDDGKVEYCVSAYDPLLVKIESEDINKTPSSSDVFFATSVRELTIKIDSDNTDDSYRPLIIYYYGPEDIDGNTGEYQTGVKRESRLVTLELNKDFKGILFAPNSPVTIKANGHKIRGMVVAQSYVYSDNTNGPLYGKFGFNKSSDLTFDDFDMLDLSGHSYTYSNVILTSQQAQHLK